MANFRRSRNRQYVAIAVIAALIAARWWSDQSVDVRPVFGSGMFQVARVVDGDTLLLADGQTRVRLQGVNSPETVKPNDPIERWGPEASDFTKALVRDAGGSVSIEIDGEPIDQHGRRLAFVWHQSQLLNEELVRAGLARATLHYDFGQAKKDRLRRAQREAQRAKRGIWSD